MNALKSIVNTLEDIRSKTEELNNAFSGAHDIQNKLLKSNIITEDILLNRQRANVLSFFQEVRGNVGKHARLRFGIIAFVCRRWK